MNDNIYIYPTDTVWGIGASIYSEVGNQSVRKIKNKDSNDPLSVLFENKVMLMDYINFPAIIKSENLFKLFNFEISLLLPILWIKKEIPKWVLCDSKYVSIRIVKNNSILKIMKDTNSPITSTSLNFSNEKPITEFIAAKSFCAEVDQEYNLKLMHKSELNIHDYKAIIVAVAHDEFKQFNIGRSDQQVVYDIKSILQWADGRL